MFAFLHFFCYTRFVYEKNVENLEFYIMIEVVAVTTKQQLRQFVKFPLKLYKGDPFYVPALYADELNILDPKKSIHQGADAECQCFLCYKDKKVVARCAGIISNLYNEKNNAKRMRISRFDCIDDMEVAKAILDAVENWGRSKGMEVIHGPLGFNDLEREGLLIEGFDRMCTFESAYSYPYYQKLLENLGYTKEVDWIEWQIKIPEKCDERNERLSEAVQKRLNIHEAEIKSVNQLLRDYYEQIFDLLDEAYGKLYGTVPITERVRKGMIAQFKLVLNKNLISILVDENDKVVGFGLVFPSIAQASHKTNGKLFPFGWIRFLHDIHHIDTMDLALIAVAPELQDKGLTAIIFHNMLSRIVEKKMGIRIAETNLQLEENEKIQQLFKQYDHEQVRRRRCYVKSLTGKELALAKSINKNAKKLKKEMASLCLNYLKKRLKKRNQNLSEG